MSGTRVETGQVWRDRDERGGVVRQVVVTSVEGDGADPGSFAWVVGQRRSRVRVSTLRARYRLLRHADGTPA